MKHLLNDALQEIIALRRRNELLQAQVDVVNAFSAALLGRPAMQGATLDVALSLQRQINDLEATERATSKVDRGAE